MTGIPSFEGYEKELRHTFGEPNSDIVTVSGLAGTGTTTVASFLCDEFDLDHVNAGEFFRDKAKEFGMSLQTFDETAEELEEKHGRDFDKEWDRTALKQAFTKNEFLLEGRLAGVLLQDIAPVRVKVVCDPEVVAERVHGRENVSLAEAKDYIRTRNQEVLNRYKHKYGVNPRKEEYYNVIVDNSENFDAVKQDLVSQVKDLLPSH